jgi:hypothetical protein
VLHRVHAANAMKGAPHRTIINTFNSHVTLHTRTHVSTHLLQDHEQDLGLHRVHAAADGLDSKLAHGKRHEQDKATREFGSL